MVRSWLGHDWPDKAKRGKAMQDKSQTTLNIFTHFKLTYNLTVCLISEPDETAMNQTGIFLKTSYLKLSINITTQNLLSFE